MTKRAKRYSGRIASTAVVAAALGLIIWALIAFAAGSVTTDKSSYPLTTRISSTLAGGFANTKYLAEFWGPSADGGTVMLRNYTAVVTTNGAGGATASYTTKDTEHTGTWTARWANNPNYSNPQAIVFDTHSSVWLGNPKTNIFYGFHLVDRSGNVIKTDQSSHIVIRLRANGSAVTGWNGVPPNVANGWTFEPATGIYWRRDATSRASGVYLDLRVGAATGDTFMPGSGTAEPGDPATFNTTMRYAINMQRVGSSSTRYPLWIKPVDSLNTMQKNEIYVPGSTSNYNYTYYFDVVGSTGANVTSTSNLTLTTAYAYVPQSSGSVNRTTNSYTYTGGHFQVRFSLPPGNKYGIYLSLTRSSYNVTNYQVLSFPATSPNINVLARPTPPDPVMNLVSTPGDRQIGLSWTNPPDPAPGIFAGVMILRNTSNNWPTPTDGTTYSVGGTVGAGGNSSTVVYNNASLTAGGDVSWTDGDSCNTSKMLQTGSTYYYKIIPYDSLRTYCTSTTEGKTGAQVPVDTTAPAAITGLAVTRQDRGNRLSWTTSSDCDYYGVRIRATTNGQEAAFDGSDGSRLVGETNGYGTGSGGFTDSPLSNGIMQYYTVWTKDDDGNWNATTRRAQGAPQDLIAPGQISDLTLTSTGAFTAGLRWTATADNGTSALSGNATSYEIRYFDQPINDSNWHQAWVPGGAALPQPSSVGTVQSYTVTGLSPMHTYYFAIRAKDEVPNTSVTSNVVSTTTLCNPELTGCDQCHQLPPTDGLPGQHPRATGNIGSHNIPIHASADPNQCNTCHANGNVFRNNSLIYAYNHQDGLVQINYSGMIGNLDERRTRTGGTWKHFSTIVYKFREYSGSTPYKVVTGTCVNTYCHGVGKGASASPMWGIENITCGEYCHEAPPSTGKHVKHYHPGAYYINFAPAGISAISGYTENDGTSGWTGTVTAVNRGFDPETGGNVDARYATYVKSSDATLTLTNLSMSTTYYLTVCCGDSSEVSYNQTVQVSGDNGATWKYVKDVSNWDTTIYKMFKKAIDIPVYVEDGQTTLKIKIGNGTDETKLNFLVLNQSPEAPKQINTVLANTPVEYGFACGKCHSNELTQAGHADHVNGAYQPGVRHAEMSFDGNSYPKNPLGIYTSLFGNATSHVDGQGFRYTTGPRCLNLYCHGSSLNAGGSNTTPQWADGYIDVEGASICGSCHDTEYKDSTPGTNISTGSHDKHVDSNFPYFFDCYKCHNNTVNPRAGDGSLSISDKTHHVNGETEVVFDKHDPTMEFGRYSTSQHACYNVYCHSNGLLDASDEPFWGTTYATPVWGSGSKSCNYCHGTATSDGMPDYPNLSTTPNSHVRHVRLNGQRCDTCHYTAVGADNVTIKKTGGSTQHVNGTADVFFNPSSLGAGASFSHVTRNCTNTYCHGSSSAPKWGDTIATCGDCHGAAPTSGRHDIHSRGNHTTITAASANGSTGAAYDYTCFFCHYSRTHGSGPVSGTQVAETNFNVVAAANCYSNASGIYTPGIVMQPEENGWNWSAGTCSNVRCHSNGRGGAPNVLANWTGALGGLGCFGCHGGLDGEQYVISTGKHLKHVSTSPSKKTCEDCHALTASANSVRDSSKHVNGSLDISIRTGGNYIPGSHDCLNVYCHSNGDPGFDRGSANFYAPSPDWFETSATSTCMTCHSDNHYNAGDSLRTAGQTLSYNHQKHLSAYNDPDYKGYGSRIGCATCHNKAASSNTALWPSAPSHSDGYKDIVFWTASTAGTAPRVAFYNMSGPSTADGGDGVWGFYNVISTGTSVSCTVICHSNGLGGAPARFSNWSAVQGGYNCSSCHGYNSATGSTLSSGAHTKHTAATGSALACYYCHRTTVSGGFGAAYINATGYISNHVNGVSNVDMALNVGGTYDTVTKTCTNVKCHGGPGNVTPSWLTGKLFCAGCHDSPPKYSQHFAHYSSLVASNTTTVSNYTRNLTNTVTYKFGCGKCHLATSISHGTGNAATGKVNQGAEVAFDAGTNPTNPLGSYTTTDELLGTDSKGFTYTNGTCRNLYCHSDGKGIYSDVSWASDSSQVTCASCHNSADTFAMMTTAAVPTTLSKPHGSHAATDRYGITCNICHRLTASSNTALARKNNHVNGTLQVYFNTFGSATGVYVSAAKSCRNTYCHSDGNGGHTGFAYGQQATWTGSLSCTGCHYGNAASGLPITTGKHGKHVNNGALANFGCVACHDLTVSDDTTISNYPNHVNAVKNVNFQVLGNQTGGYASMTCRNNYCHSSGQTPSAADNTPVFKTPTWSEAAWSYTCNKCHGTTNPYGAPDYANMSTADRALYNTHLVPGHVNSAADCIHCHMHTVDSFGNITTGSTQHINGTREVVFQLGGTYDPVNKYCTDVACHGRNTTPLRWGGPSQNCSNCHSDMGAGYSDSEHQYTGNHKKHTDPGTYRFACEICHATKNSVGNISHGTGNVSFVQGGEVVFSTSSTAWRLKSYKNLTAMRYRRMDQVWDITGSTGISYTAKDMAGYDAINGDIKWTFGQCSNVWCHASGQDNGGYVAYVNWSSTTTNCVSCHGNKTSQTLSYAHDKHVNGGFRASFGCVVCHKATVSDDTTLISYDKHVNGLRDVSFQLAMANSTGAYVTATKTCRNNYCHSSGQRMAMTNTSSFPAFRTPRWLDSGYGCNACHGVGTAWGQPNYPNRSTASRAWFNTHMVAGHVNSASDCIHCHVGTVDASGNLADGTTQHLNGSREVSFQLGGTYDPAAKSCSGTDATDCHGSMTIVWGGWGSASGCAMCHLASGSDVDDYVYGNAVKSMVSYEQYTAVGHGKMGNYLFTPSGAGAANPSVPGRNASKVVGNCNACHDSTAAHNTAGNIFRVKNGGDSNAMCAGCHAANEANHHSQAITGGDAWADFTPKCVDCHDPHGDVDTNGRMNFAMIQQYVNYSTNSSSDGIPTFTKAASFPADATLPGTLGEGSFVTADFKGICQICHRAGGDPMRFFSKDQYDTSHSAGNACGACHRHPTGFQGAGECKTCHGTGGLGTQAGRADIQKQFENSSSHHIVASTWSAMSSKSCSFCHAEGTADGNPGSLHRSGKAVVLNVWTGISFVNGNSIAGVAPKGFVRYTTGGGSSAGMARSNSSVLTPVCIGCHSEGNKNATPFADSGDNSTPVRYSWDNNSVGSKYANVSTTPWGKFNSTTYNVVPADTVTKAFSPHGNAGANQSVMSIGQFSTYASTKAVGCYDCHNGHASNVSGGTSYASGNRQGGIFKQISTANGIYSPTAGGSTGTKNMYSVSGALCFDCHYGDNPKAPKKYTDFGLAQGKTIAGSYYDRVGLTNVWENWSTSRWSTSDVWRGSFAFKDANFKGGHFGNSMGNMKESGYRKINSTVNGTTTGGSCAACHDPHGVSPVTKRNYTKPVPTSASASTTGSPVVSGTVASADVNQSRVVVLQITANGTGTNNPTFRYSTNGGKTWTASSSVTTTVLTGMTVSWNTGNYYSDDTWTFMVGANPNFMVPALKGTWMHSPYKEDRPPRKDYTTLKSSANEANARLANYPKANDYTDYQTSVNPATWFTAIRLWDDSAGGTSNAVTNRYVGGPAPRGNPDFRTGSYVPGYNIVQIQGDGFGRGPVRYYGFTNNTSHKGWNGYFVDENTFGSFALKTYGQNVPFRSMTGANPAATPGNFAGLCLQCHAWARNTGTALNNVTSWNMVAFGGTGHVTTKPHETVMTLGGITVNAMKRDESAGTYSGNNPTWGMHMSQYNGSDGTYYHGPTGRVGSSLGTVDPTAGGQNRMHYYRWGVNGSSQTGTTFAQGMYHRFPCAKCHTPHVSRLPRLMKTNCLDNDNVGTAHTTMAYVTNGTTLDTTASKLWGANIRNVACHSTKIGAVSSSSSTYYPGGWNNKTPW